MWKLWDGWRFHDGKLYAPEWRQGLREGDIRSLPYQFALIASLKKEVRCLHDELKDAELAVCQAESKARYYQSQLILESRYGLMLARIHEQT